MLNVTYEVPKMRLAGLHHFGGIVQIVETADGGAVLTFSQIVPGTHGTLWKRETVTHNATNWQLVKPMVLAQCVIPK